MTGISFLKYAKASEAAKAIEELNGKVSQSDNVTRNFDWTSLPLLDFDRSTLTFRFSLGLPSP